MTEKKYEELSDQFAQANTEYNRLLEENDGDKSSDKVKDARIKMIDLREDLDTAYQQLILRDKE